MLRFSVHRTGTAVHNHAMGMLQEKRPDPRARGRWAGRTGAGGGVRPFVPEKVDGNAAGMIMPSPPRVRS